MPPCVADTGKGDDVLVKIYIILVAAIAAEVVATTALARSESFTRLVPSVVAVLGYVVAFWLLSFCLRSIPTGVVYALWSGMGIVLITAVAWVVYQQKLDAPALLGIALILAGVAVINLFSKAVNH
jgi:small multidrug resistance pump